MDVVTAGMIYPEKLTYALIFTLQQVLFAK